jgi:PadR family transcriptional regulator AphA
VSTKFALLGLLDIHKMSAYALEKFAKESIGYFWNESYSNVHRTLNMLAEERLVTKSAEPGSRNKNIFDITDLGRKALSEWLSNHKHTTIYRDELLLKLFVSKRKDYPALLIDLKHVLNELLEQQEVYVALQKSFTSGEGNLSYDLVLDYGIVQNDATIAWLKKTIQRMEAIL